MLSRLLKTEIMILATLNLLSADALNLVKSKKLSFGKELKMLYLLNNSLPLSHNIYHTIPTFNDPKEENFGKHCGKRRKCWSPAFSPFPTVFSTQS